MTTPITELEKDVEDILGLTSSHSPEEMNEVAKERLAKSLVRMSHMLVHDFDHVDFFRAAGDLYSKMLFAILMTLPDDLFHSLLDSELARIESLANYALDLKSELDKAASARKNGN